MNKKVAKAFKDLPLKTKANFLRTFEQWCESYPLPDSRHKRNEGRYAHGGASILRQAFASGHVRIYGWVETIEGVETFVLVDYDANKKRQDADQDLLAEVGRKAFLLKAAISEVYEKDRKK